MPLRVSTGLSKKQGLPNFGSTGASCTVEFELEASLLQTDLEGFRQHVKNAFVACSQAVADELARQGTGNGHVSPENGHDTNGNGRQQRSGRSATASQVRALHSIASRQRLDLAAEVRNRFNIDRPEDLLIGEASELIDAIKPDANGNGGQR